MTQPESLSIDGTKYIREDLAASEPDQSDGLDYCIVRSREQGVMCGYVESVQGRTVKLIQARQMWRYDSRFVLPDIAEFGVRNAEACKFSAPMSQTATMLEACGILTCTAVGGQSLRNVKAQSK
jgi:hypothetical protein